MMRLGQDLRNEDADNNKPEPKLKKGMRFKLITTIGVFRRRTIQVIVTITDIEYGMHGVFENEFLDYEYLYTLTNDEGQNFFKWESDLVK